VPSLETKQLPAADPQKYSRCSAMILRASLLALCAALCGAATPTFTLLKDSTAVRSTDQLTVSISPLQRRAGVNVFTFGADTDIDLQLELSRPISHGATVQAWLSELSVGSAARVAANAFIPLVDVCSELAALSRNAATKGLPRKCPVPKAKRFPFRQKIGSKLWRAVREYRDRLVGAEGVLELRLWSGKPCTVCWNKPELLLGMSIPFQIGGGGHKKEL